MTLNLVSSSNQRKQKGLTINTSLYCSPTNSTSPDFKTASSHSVDLNITHVLPQLYLGGNKDVTIENIKERNITVIINITLRNECQSPLFLKSEEYSNVKYYRIELNDKSDAPISTYLIPTIEIIHNSINEGHNVLVHCRKGMSRSVSFIIAYLMIYQGYTYDDAFEYLKNRRSCISVNIGFSMTLQTLR